MSSDHLVRGILVGGSVGVFAGLLGFAELGRGAALGMLMGFFAGLTMARRAERRAKDQERREMEEFASPSPRPGHDEDNESGGGDE